MGKAHDFLVTLVERQKCVQNRPLRKRWLNHCVTGILFLADRKRRTIEVQA
jgi:hypothetical protein